MDITTIRKDWLPRSRTRFPSNSLTPSVGTRTVSGVRYTLSIAQFQPFSSILFLIVSRGPDVHDLRDRTGLPPGESHSPYRRGSDTESPWNNLLLAPRSRCRFRGTRSSHVDLRVYRIPGNNSIGWDRVRPTRETRNSTKSDIRGRPETPKSL